MSEQPPQSARLVDVLERAQFQLRRFNVIASDRASGPALDALTRTIARLRAITPPPESPGGSDNAALKISVMCDALGTARDVLEHVTYFYSGAYPAAIATGLDVVKDALALMNGSPTRKQLFEITRSFTWRTYAESEEHARGCAHCTSLPPGVPYLSQTRVRNVSEAQPPQEPPESAPSL